VFNRIIVPTDGSDYSWRAVAVGEALARQCDAPLELLEVVTYAADLKRAEQLIRERLADTPLSTPASAHARVMQRSVGFTIADHVTNVNGGMIVMSTFGRGRTEAILGSVAVDVLREMVGPLVLVGPRASTDRSDLRGELIVPVDGSDFSEATLSLGAAWGIGLEARPWVVEVLEPDQVQVPDTSESSYVARLARETRRLSHHDVQYEVLHSNHPGKAIGDFAHSIEASLIVASTHGRTGLARLALGSVAMEIVRHAPCPVVLNRPPTLPRETLHCEVAQTNRARAATG
jgi:nucleotide-binding universal stress UspA family protein